MSSFIIIKNSLKQSLNTLKSPKYNIMKDFLKYF
jgi:hypothetical protein